MEFELSLCNSTVYLKDSRNEGLFFMPLFMIDAARGILREVYGEDDIHSSEKIGLRLTFSQSMYEERGGVELFGKNITKATGRDSGAWVGDDCAFEVGSPKSIDS